MQALRVCEAMETVGSLPAATRVASLFLRDLEPIEKLSTHFRALPMASST